MRSFELGRKTVVDAPARLALASPSVTLPTPSDGTTVRAKAFRTGGFPRAVGWPGGRHAKESKTQAGDGQTEAWEGHDADRAALHHNGPVALCGDPVPAGGKRDPQPGRLDRFPAGRHRSAGRVEPGRDRCAGAKVLPQGRRPGAAEKGRGERRPLLPVALRDRREEPGEAA